MCIQSNYYSTFIEVKMENPSRDPKRETFDRNVNCQLTWQPLDVDFFSYLSCPSANFLHRIPHYFNAWSHSHNHKYFKVQGNSHVKVLRIFFFFLK